MLLPAVPCKAGLLLTALDSSFLRKAIVYDCLGSASELRRHGPLLAEEAPVALVCGPLHKQEKGAIAEGCPGSEFPAQAGERAIACEPLGSAAELRRHGPLLPKKAPVAHARNRSHIEPYFPHLGLGAEKLDTLPGSAERAAAVTKIRVARLLKLP